MATLNMGYHFERAKEGNHKFSLFIDDKEVIKEGTYSSTLSNFKYLSNYHRNRHLEVHIVMKKIYDCKTRKAKNQKVREFDNRREF